MLVPQRATPRWKEWIPLVSQQQRLRNLIQIYAYNVSWSPGCSFYFTLHLTSMSPPFYTSEHVNHQHPRWIEVEITSLESRVNTSASGVVIRLWRRQEDHSTDQIILVWGLHFSGLVYLGPCLNVSATQFNENTIVLHLQGGFFTDQSSLKELPHDSLVRHFSVLLSSVEVKPSYSVSLLLRLRNIQQTIKKQTQQSLTLKEKILAGDISASDNSLTRESNPTLRKLLNKSKPKPQQKQEIFAARCQLEVLRFRVALLRQEKLRKMAQVESLLKQRDFAAAENSDRSCELTARYQALNKETEQLKENHRQFGEMRELFLSKSSQLSFRRKQLISQLSLIYPVVQAGRKYTICGVHLPNSEDLASTDDISVSVALGFVAHLVQMVSIFLQVPLRYPIIHFGSRSKIIDFISDKIPDKDREFPLFSRGKDKLQFHYGVYLLNKDIAQLRWLVGFPTNDLSATLHNVYHLLHLNQFPTLESQHRSMSGSSLDIISSSTNVSPVGSMLSTQTSSHFGVIRSRASKSVGSSEALFRGKKKIDVYSGMSPPTFKISTDGIAGSGSLSYSLDTGLNEYGEIKKVGASAAKSNNAPYSCDSPPRHQLAHVGSEPNLAVHSTHNELNSTIHEPSFLCNSQVEYVQRWQVTSEAVLDSSNDNLKVSCLGASENDSKGCKSEFTIVTERIAELVGSCVEQDDQCSSSGVSSLNLQPSQIGTSDLCSSTYMNRVVGKECEDVPAPSRISIITSDIMSHDECNSIGSGDFESVTLKSNSFSEQPSEVLLPLSSSGDTDVDIGTDALDDLTSNKLSPVSEKCKVAVGDTSGNLGSQSRRPPESHLVTERRVGSEENGMECIGVEERVLVDNLFANVTSRTEALASSTTSFNLMGSRHGSS